MSDSPPNDAVAVVAYSPTWPLLFEDERARLAAALGDGVVEIEHIGSTSVPGLSAKPVIDILVAVERFDPLEACDRRLAPLGYWRPTPQDFDESAHRFYRRGSPRSHHLHMVQFGTWEHRRHLVFRDYLRGHPDIARLYADVKRELALAFKHNRPAYTNGKTAFIKSIVARALAEMADPALSALAERATHPQDTGSHDSP